MGTVPIAPGQMPGAGMTPPPSNPSSGVSAPNFGAPLGGNPGGGNPGMSAPGLDPASNPFAQNANAKPKGGGGFVDNIPRCLPKGLGAEINTSAWKTPPLFDWLQRQAGIGLEEAHRIFNMGIGMVAIVAPEHADAFDQLVPEPTYLLGRIVEGDEIALV